MGDFMAFIMVLLE